MSEDSHIRHVDEFRPHRTAEPPSSGNYSISSVDSTSNTGSVAWDCSAIDWNKSDQAIKEEQRLEQIRQNQEWERRLWKARQKGRNVPTFGRG